VTSVKRLTNVIPLAAGFDATAWVEWRVMAGRRDFASDEWATMQRAMMASGMLVSLADGTVDQDELHNLTMELRSARFAHRSQLVHELADVPTLNTESRPPATYASLLEPGLEAIRAAVEIVARKAPAELPHFQEFLVKLAEVVADANRKGDILGVGAQRRTPEEVAAIEAIRSALGL
jgi:hypothetical protein